MEDRGTVYCVIPDDLPVAPELDRLLREHFRDDPNVDVVIERRRAERRSRVERSAGAPGRFERRLAGDEERRVGERRAALVPVAPRPVPSEAGPYAGRLTFVERLEHREQADPRSRAGWEMAAALQAGAETWRRRYLESERDAEELATALRNVIVGVREMGSPSRTARLPLGVRRAEEAMNRYRERSARRSAG